MQKTFLGGQFYPAIAGTISNLRAQQQELPPLNATTQSASLADVMGAMGEYDALCSLEKAVNYLNEKNSAKTPTNPADKK